MRRGRIRLSKNAQVGLARYSTRPERGCARSQRIARNSTTLSRNGNPDRYRRSGTSPQSGGKLKLPIHVEAYVKREQPSLTVSSIACRPWSWLRVPQTSPFSVSTCEMVSA
jgi:hypothetical protein